MVDVKIKLLNKNAILPKRATEGSAAVDLCAAIDEPWVIEAGETAIVPTGLAMEVPKGYGAFIFARSGLGIIHGIVPSNCVGIIDSDYRGEVKVILVNISNEAFVIENGERIAQIVFAKHETAEFEEVRSLNETERGAGGFGSTGTK